MTRAKPNTWSNHEALITGSRVSVVKSLIVELADGLVASIDSLDGPGSEAVIPFSLGYGLGGIALFFYYLDRNELYPNAKIVARELLERCLASVKDIDMTLTAPTGFTGVGWLLSHVINEGLDSLVTDDDIFSDLNSILRKWSSLDLTSSEYFLGRGSACLFAAEQLPSNSGVELGREILSDLEKCSVSSELGRTWPIAYQYRHHTVECHGVSDSDLANGVATYCAIAHGVAGIAASISGLCASPALEAQASRLSREAWQWLSLQRSESANACDSFPYLSTTSVPHHTSGWCNGDLGILTAMVSSEVSFGGDTCEKVLTHALANEVHKTVIDVEGLNQSNLSICHGSAGRAHLFNRLFHYKNCDSFRVASTYWLDRTIYLLNQFQSPLDAFKGSASDQYPGKTARSLLMGASGVGLAMMATICSTEPAWDRFLLISHRSNQQETDGQ